MAVERKPITIHYRKFSRATTVPNTLEGLVRGAMNAKVTGGVQIKKRYLERLNTVGSDNYFINTYCDGLENTPLVFGDILHFTKGHLQALCNTADDNAASVPVEQMKAPEQSEYVHSQMFWMIKGDHAFVVQSMSLRTTEFEQYLDWLLKNKTTQLHSTHPIILDARFDEDVVGGDLSDIQEIIVGGIAAVPATVPDDGVLDKVTEITQHGQIDTKRSTGWATATAIKAKGTRVSADGTIRLHHNASIRLIKKQDGDNQIISSLLDPTDVLRAMVEAYNTFVANGKIQE